MERGPMALFWAIMAFGIGPALWLGAQLGEITPSRPPAAVVDQARVPAGAGAGAVPDDGPVVLDIDADDRPVPAAVNKPAPRRGSAPRATTAPPPVATQPTNAVPSVEPSASASSPTTESPTESTPQPTTPAPPPVLQATPVDTFLTIASW